MRRKEGDLVKEGEETQSKLSGKEMNMRVVDNKEERTEEKNGKSTSRIWSLIPLRQLGLPE